jgi:DNA-binding beta-propeller fold protein YncE
VIEGATCSATVTTGCAQSPPVIAVGNGPVGVAVNQATGTACAANSGDNTVSQNGQRAAEYVEVLLQEHNP